MSITYAQINKDSIRLKEIWDVKETLFEEVKHLSIEDALKKISENANKTSAEFIKNRKIKNAA